MFGGGINEFGVSPFGITAGGISLGTVVCAFGVLSLVVSGSVFPGGVDGPSGGVMEGGEGTDMRTRHDEVMLTEEIRASGKIGGSAGDSGTGTPPISIKFRRSIKSIFSRHSLINSRNTALYTIALLVDSHI